VFSMAPDQRSDGGPGTDSAPERLGGSTTSTATKTAQTTDPDDTRRISLSGNVRGTGGWTSEREFQRRVCAQLNHRELPSVEVDTFHEGMVDLRDVAGLWTVLYVYPGSPSSPDGGTGSRVDDSVQHCVFRDAEKDLLAHRLSVVGLSSKAMRPQHLEGLNSRVSHKLVSDPELLLAKTLGLPTFDQDGKRWYRRLVLVVSDGYVKKVFFPVPSAERSAAQVLTWTQATSF
jgi:peroxiredoxin